MEEITAAYGEDYAKKYVASPGYSEHHTGLAVDVGIFYPDGSQGSFSESQNAVWMRNNCQHFGFVRRYAEDKTAITGISNEAWHFRYVGMPHAFYMTAHNLCLEEYIDFFCSINIVFVHHKKLFLSYWKLHEKYIASLALGAAAGWSSLRARLAGPAGYPDRRPASTGREARYFFYLSRRIGGCIEDPPCQFVGYPHYVACHLRHAVLCHGLGQEASGAD
jgi:hypothetical protein